MDPRGAVLVVTGDRLPELWNEVARREYPPDLDARINGLAADLEKALADAGGLTEKHRAALAEVPGEVSAARRLLLEAKDFRVALAYQLALGHINRVCVDVFGAVPL